jgi:YVTN family beta-propeller protein
MLMRRVAVSSCAVLALLLAAGACRAQSSFVNFESSHVHPLERTPDGARLLAVNTADHSLEVFDLTGPALVALPAIPVGLDPVSVRARTSAEAWVVNVISDSVSIVDLPTGRVRATLDTDDEPCDVVFAGTPQRAFVSCSGSSTVLVFDPANLAAAPLKVALDADTPRAMATSPAGDKVYVAFFRSGNGSTTVGGGFTANVTFPPNFMNDPTGPYGGVNPPPNDPTDADGDGSLFEPHKNPANPAPPKVALIVKKDAGGAWRDDNGTDWTPWISGPSAAATGRPVGWDMPDHDVAVIDAASLAVSWVNRLMNMNMALAVNPASGLLSVVGTEATNEVRYEPVVKGTFVRVQLALADAGTGSATLLDLNPHLTYAVATVPQALRDLSLGDPRGIAWNAGGTRAYVTGMGSNNLVVIDAAGARAGLAPTVEVGEGPTGVAVDDARGLVYVLDRFEGAISVLSAATELETARVPFHDASPAAIKTGRKHLYDTRKSSGLGQVACASCHIDARMDRLAWDLGDPSGAMKSTSGQNLGANIPGLSSGFADWHPMKGPMLTQTLLDIVGKEPQHWRGDRAGLEEFNGAFVGLQGDDVQLTPAEMQEFEDFLATLHVPPNPFRNFDNTLPTSLPLPGHFTTGRFAPAGAPLPNGNAVTGLARYRPPNTLDTAGGVGIACVTCHTLPVGVGTDYRASPPFFTTLAPFPVGPKGEHHTMMVSVDGATNVSMKIPQLRNIYERGGFNATQLSNRAGFGFAHDGTVDSIERFVSEPVFAVTSDQDVANLTAFMLSFAGSELPQGSTSTLALEPPGGTSQDAHAAVGAQTTLVTLAGAPAAQVALMNSMLALANASKVGLVAKGLQGGIARGWRYDGSNSWQSDRVTQTVTTAALQAGAAAGSEITFTVVPKGSQTRIGIDRDLDGVLDRDELDGCADPADAGSVPGTWLNLGSALAGTAGLPSLLGCGTLAAGDPVTLTLAGTKPFSGAYLVIGVTALNAPLKGGVMVPSPLVLLGPFSTGASGTLALGGPMAPGLPSGFPLFFQDWMADPGGVQGFAASNGLQGITP